MNNKQITMQCDVQLEQEILNELERTPFSVEDHIRIRVKNGIVILNGRSRIGFHRMAAVRNEIKNMAGVKHIINNVKIISARTAEATEPKS